MTEGYLRIKVKNAQDEAGRHERKIADLRIELNHYVDLYRISTNEAAFFKALLEEFQDGSMEGSRTI